MAIVAGQTASASDVKAIKDDVDAIISAMGGVVLSAESTSSTSYTDLSTSGPAVTLTTGTTALVLISAEVENDTSGEASVVSYAISGATSESADDTHSALFFSDSAGQRATIHHHLLWTGLTAGSNTFTMKYRSGSGGGSATFRRRRITVIPLGD